MNHYFDLFVQTTLQTKIFIISIWFLFGIVQYFLFRIKYPYITLPTIQIFLGFLLYKLGHYYLLVHLIIYIAPSLLISALLYGIFYKKPNAILNDPFAITLNTDKGKLIFNPFAGVLGFAVPKGGKTASLVRPTISELAKKGYCGMAFDFKKGDITRTVHHFYANTNIRVVSLNFPNPNLSYRMNPFHPKYIVHPAYVLLGCGSFIDNMLGISNKNGSEKYFNESAASLFAAVAWSFYLDYPQFCDFPHIISFILLKSDAEITNFVTRNTQSTFWANSFLQCLDAADQKAGIKGTLGLYLSKIATPEMFWVLSGDEINPNLNDPDNPTFLCLTSDSSYNKIYAPAYSLVFSMCMRLMNVEGKHHSALVIDEGHSFVVPGFHEIPATARSNKIATFLFTQDYSQLKAAYGQDGVDQILSCLSTHIHGRVTSPEIADKYSKMYGTFDKIYTSTSRKTGATLNSSYTDSFREVRNHKPHEFQNLNTGEFIAYVADGNMTNIKAQFNYIDDIPFELPIINNVSNAMITQNFNQIIEDINGMI